MSAWGKTGRVEVESHNDYLDPESRVFMDGRKVGEVWPIVCEGLWFGTIGATDDPPRPFGWSPDLPTLDHAVMWVLRRAAPDVWREERGPVWRVMRKDCFWWAYPKGASRGRPRAHADQGSAVIYADRRAREATP